MKIVFHVLMCKLISIYISILMNRYSSCFTLLTGQIGTGVTFYIVFSLEDTIFYFVNTNNIHTSHSSRS